MLLTAHLAILVRHKHTQFAGRGRTERNVVGSRLWPTFTAKTLGLFFFVFAVCAALGGLAQINPVWIYGPFQPAAVSAGSQPDWYIGWLEGALRLHAAVGDPGRSGFEIPNPFFPGVLLPGITFMLLYAWPFLEAPLHEGLPRSTICSTARATGRSARPLGVGALAFYVVLFVAGGNDVIAARFDLSVNLVTYVFRCSLFVLPVVVGFVTYRLCKELSARDPTAGRRGQLGAARRRTADGRLRRARTAEELSPSP